MDNKLSNSNSPPQIQRRFCLCGVYQEGTPENCEAFNKCERCTNPGNFFQERSQIETQLLRSNQASNTIYGKIRNLWVASSRNHISLKQEDCARLQFLKDTLERTDQFLMEQDKKMMSLHSYRILFSIRLSRMDDVGEMLRKIECGESAITPNFDIFELKLRGIYEEFRCLFPLTTPLATPADVIQDQDARAMWLKHFGPDTYFVQFKTFLDFLVQQNFLDESSPLYETYVLNLRYFVNFPSDDVVTAYKWDLLTRLFGPYQMFAQNFCKIVGGRGFLGLINRIQAYEILVLSPPKTFLIRLSRTEPQFLAFSYKNSKGKIGHQVNKDPKTALPIPVEQFIQEKFPSYRRVNKSLQVEEKILHNQFQPLSEYAKRKEAYFR